VSKPISEAAMAQTSPHAGALLTLQRVQPFERRGIAVASDALDADGRIQDRYSAWHDDEAPGLRWSAILEAQSYVLVVEDPDAPGDRPFLHWLMWNIPGTATEIPAGLPRSAHSDVMSEAVQGLNGHGQAGWYGTKPPAGHGLHRYHFQLFALSKTLDLPPTASLEEVVSALKGLTIASGELVGTYERLDSAGDAPSPAHTGGYGADPYADTVTDRETGRGGLDRDDRDRHARHTADGEVLR
jgi:Raf kinase inhibitor-like YbhB/YbcL family protein